MKKLLCWMLAFLLCFGLFAGCDSYDRDDDDDDDDDDFSLWGEKDEDDMGLSFGEENEKKETMNATEATQEPTQSSTAPTTAAPSTAPRQEEDERPTQTTKDPAQLYTEYLTNGGYQKLVAEYGPEWTSAWTVTACLLDLNADGKDELLLQLADEAWMGVRGYPTVSVLLTVQNNTVVVLTKTYYSGGSMGGTFLYVIQDEQQGRPNIAAFTYGRGGPISYVNSITVYSYNGVRLNSYFTCEEVSFSIAEEEDRAKEIQGTTSNYQINGDQFCYWTADGNYVSQQDYNASHSCYPIQHDRLVKTSQANPLP